MAEDARNAELLDWVAQPSVRRYVIPITDHDLVFGI